MNYLNLIHKLPTKRLQSFVEYEPQSDDNDWPFARSVSVVWGAPSSRWPCGSEHAAFRASEVRPGDGCNAMITLCKYSILFTTSSSEVHMHIWSITAEVELLSLPPIKLAIGISAPRSSWEIPRVLRGVS
jgi:hypothetical protein